MTIGHVVRRRNHRVASPPTHACDDESVRWLVTLEGNRRDVERLLAESSERLSATEESLELALEITDTAHDVATDESRQAGRTLIDAAVRHLNGFGKLRWGRTYEGVTVKTVRYFDSVGRPGGQVVFVQTAYDHMLPDDYADMVERLGFPRPPVPAGVEDVNALDLAMVTALSADDPEVARVLRLIELMLEGDEEIDWAAGYSALEVIDQYARRQGVSGQALGWWTRKEFDRFTQMANSVKAVGIRSRHQGHRFSAPRKPLPPKEGSWFVRRVAARWIAWLLAAEERTRDPG
jgi:hypothetical protein